ncbi:MAG: hypothetical protein RLZZ130_355 [Pseudomonadota bacterium]|jgi:hypothetical protein
MPPLLRPDHVFGNYRNPNSFGQVDGRIAREIRMAV